MFDTDKRWKQLGEVFVNNCLELKKGEKLMIAQYEPETWPLALATYEAATVKLPVDTVYENNGFGR